MPADAAARNSLSHARSGRHGQVLTRFRLARHSALDETQASVTLVAGLLLCRVAEVPSRNESRSEPEVWVASQNCCKYAPGAVRATA